MSVVPFFSHGLHRLLVALIIGTLMSFGCGAGDSDRVAVEKLKSVAANLSKRVDPPTKDYPEATTYHEVAYDVTRTSSLVAPLAGKLGYNTRVVHATDGTTILRTEVDLVFTDGRWQIRRKRTAIVNGGNQFSDSPEDSWRIEARFLGL